MSILVAANLHPFESDTVPIVFWYSMHTSFIEQSPVLEATSVFAIQILHILWNPKFHFHVHNK